MKDSNDIMTFDGRIAEALFLSLIDMKKDIEINGLKGSNFQGTFFNFSIDKYITFKLSDGKLILKADKDQAKSEELLRV